MESVFPIVPAGPRPYYIMVPAILIILLAMLVIVWTLNGAQRSRLEITSSGLRFRGDVWGRKTIPFNSIRGRDARVVNLDTETPLRPHSRRMGTGLPGYASGWFRLQNGEKALIYVTDRQRVAYIPTDLGYSILASVRDPEGLLTALRSAPGS